MERLFRDREHTGLWVVVQIRYRFCIVGNIDRDDRLWVLLVMV